jgi:hypothetical protein
LGYPTVPAIWLVPFRGFILIATLGENGGVGGGLFDTDCVSDQHGLAAAKRRGADVFLSVGFGFSIAFNLLIGLEILL